MSKEKKIPEITVANKAGFCAGVKVAVNKLEKELDATSGGKVFTVGHIVHNPGVVSELESKGATVINSASEAPDGAVIVVRAHGLPEKEWSIIRERELRFTDGTCGKVKKIHSIIRESAAAGKTLFITGYGGHAETEAHISIAPELTVLINSPEEASAVESFDNPAILISQTTFDREHFEDIKRILIEKAIDGALTVHDTICSNMRSALDSASTIAASVELMIVIGGKNSSNTKRLFDACAEKCDNTIHIESPQELNISSISQIKSIGITAGASTPQKDIDEVVRLIKNE